MIAVQRRQPLPLVNPVSLFLLLLLVLAAVAALPALRDIPFTNHARDGHADQAYNATVIQERMSSKSCAPILTYVCEDATIVMCPVGPDPNGLWMALRIGTATGEPGIVTGFAAPRSYWAARVAGCTPVSYVP